MQSKDPLRSKESIPLLWKNRFCWLPFIGALITLIPTILVILNLWQGLPKQKFPEIEELKAMAFFVGYLDARTFYFLALLFWAVSTITTIILTGYIIAHYLKGASKKQRWAWAVLLLIVISICALEKKIDFYEHIFRPTIDQVQQLEKKHKYDDPRFLSRADSVANLVKIMAAIGILMVVAAFAASLHTAQKGKPASVVDVVASQRRKLLLTLYSGAALLISGVVATFAYVRIPSVFLSGDSAQYMREVAMLITVTYGVTFTLSLAGAYIPASIVITERAKSLAAGFGKEKPDFDTKKWLEEQNLATSPVQHLTRGVAILAPFLVSLSQLVANVF